MVSFLQLVKDMVTSDYLPDKIIALSAILFWLMLISYALMGVFH